ncbi:glyoxalase/bleomycin resistance/extradiol dioxygenase family protein [Halovulum dunhuangense]|uniref:Glyoxalase/bleomycin resistance/extradiol dioxygenase family protein n=1 Tax=Halovulum dunhuangense TaxID=1505036 RepID=A0A849L483_9RHOB|nr:VOC family protein [Halovulum dunhuangense]NNU80961.1 glyoxalase/bleomycin resistance/extradiol dioxygenase family protein [Halovulum dunhuangense]
MSKDDRKPPAILEAALYAEDLEAAEAFYAGVLGLPVVARQSCRHVFFRVRDGVLLVFRASATEAGDTGPVPGHGARGPGHLCFAASAAELEDWVARLKAAHVPIEADVRWPGGARSIYLRDPAGNSLEFAEPRLWAES